MEPEKNITILLKDLNPILNEGEYVFCCLPTISDLDVSRIIGLFKEHEGWTIVVNKTYADESGYSYTYIASWITLTVNSSLEAVGLTAALSTALAKRSISCNVFAAYHHDHIFVAPKDAKRALDALKQLATVNL
jgi:hypothetical protein